MEMYALTGWIPKSIEIEKLDRDVLMYYMHEFHAGDMVATAMSGGTGDKLAACDKYCLYECHAYAILDIQIIKVSVLLASSNENI